MSVIAVAAAGARLPVTILTGFLGSGKTTVLAQLLKHPALARTAGIINELGEVGLDHDLGPGLPQRRRRRAEGAQGRPRAAVAGRRSTSRAAAAIDILAATPLVSATTLAAGLGMAIKNAAAMLDAFAAAGVVVEVTNRSKRRLFGLSGLEPLRDKVAPPRRPEPGRGRGRPPAIKTEEVLPLPPLPERPLSPIERKAIDYSDLERWMAHADQVIRDTRRALDSLARGKVASAAVPSQGAPALQPDLPSDDPPDPWLVDDQMQEHE